MTYFLERIASLIYDQYHDHLDKQCLVFPNRRAGLYFLKYLSAKINRPVWTPEIVTINELFGSYSTLQTADNEILLFELYKVYRTLRQTPESFDEFYFWGDMLLNDFDDIDKYIVDSSMLFRIVGDIREIDQQFGGLSQEQIEIIKRFWINFNMDKPSFEKTGFIGIWNILDTLYNGLKSLLKEKNIAYEGMIFREVVEKSLIEANLEIKWEQVHFIGFNALNSCEKELMQYYKRAGKAKFYWDYDNSYVIGNKFNSAGFFLKQNIKLFGNDMPSDWKYDTLLSKGADSVNRRVIDTSSDVAQLKLISGLINEIPGISQKNAHHTAIVLADENLLLPLLSSLPVTPVDVNITMGYPLKQTPVYTFISHLLKLQKNVRTENGNVLFQYNDVTDILKSRFISGLIGEETTTIINRIISGNLLWVSSEIFMDNGFLKLVFQNTATPVLLSSYLKEILKLISVQNEQSGRENGEAVSTTNIRNEFIYRIILSINRIETAIGSQDIVISKETYIRILDKVLRGQSVPFSGEPLSGIQIMGILETRALDFSNLVIVSANDGILPGVSAGSSFIPFSLREAFALPTINHQESIYAYHFYRLLQRAENVTFIYNSNSEGLKTGEMSRFLIQMKYDSILKPEFINLRFEIKTHNPLITVIERETEHLNQLRGVYLNGKESSSLSPTAINTWLNCSMRFYYRYVCRLKEPEKISAEIDPAIFGTLLHNAVKKIYSDLVDIVADRNAFDKLISNNTRLDKVTEEVIGAMFARDDNSILRGNEMIIKEILKTYIQQVLVADRSLAPIKILNLEDVFRFDLRIQIPGVDGILKTGGIVDRIDDLAGVTRIVDYKTGNVANRIGSIADLFGEKRKKEYDGWLQTLLYCEAFLKLNPGKKIRPAIYRIRELSGDQFTDSLRIKGINNQDIIIDDYLAVREEFLMHLNDTVNSMFSNDTPFRMTEDTMKCEYCPYRSLCMR